MKWIFILGLTLVYCLAGLSVMAEEQTSKYDGKTKSNVSATGEVQKALCNKVSILIKNKTIEKYVLNGKNCEDEIDLRCTNYSDFDIDNDSIKDMVKVSSGSQDSYLEVKLSNGIGYDLDESGFIMLVKLKGQIYAIVTYWKWDRQSDASRKGEKVGNRLYKLTNDKAKLVCDIEDLKRR